MLVIATIAGIVCSAIPETSVVPVCVVEGEEVLCAVLALLPSVVDCSFVVDDVVVGRKRFVT